MAFNRRTTRTAARVSLGLGLLGSLIFSLTFAQSAPAVWSTQSLIPNVMSISVPTAIIAFKPGRIALTTTQQRVFGQPPGCPLAKRYPPASFPACYPATLTSGTLPVLIFNNNPGPWSLLLELRDLVDTNSLHHIPADQVWYRVNGGPWQRATNAAQNLYTNSGPTSGYLKINVEFALELTGGEQAGQYAANAVITALRQP